MARCVFSGSQLKLVIPSIHPESGRVGATPNIKIIWSAAGNALVVLRYSKPVRDRYFSKDKCNLG